MRKNEFVQGLKDGLPICLGYFSVSVAFGMTTVLVGMPLWAAVLISLTNLTSAGQFAGANLMLAGGAGTYDPGHQYPLLFNVPFCLSESGTKNEYERTTGSIFWYNR